MNSGQKKEFLQETNFEDLDDIQETPESKKKKRILNKYPQWNQENTKNQ